MQIKIFQLSSSNAKYSEDELNKFLRSHRILRVEHHFVERDCSWALLVEYQDEQPDAVSPVAKRRNKKDVTEGMSDELRQRYEHLRKIRTQLSMQRSVPAYVIFTNDELVLLAHEPELNEDTVKRIRGIAPSRLKDNVRYFFDELSDNETHWESD